MCDASDFAVGAILGQRKDKVFHAIYYASHTLTNSQLNYTTTEKELLVVVFTSDKFRAYLAGTKVTVSMDHSAIKDRKGTENQVVDHLSRIEAGNEDGNIQCIQDDFPDEQLFVTMALPWYVNIIIQRCVLDDEIQSILYHCHITPYGGHSGGMRITAKVLQTSSYWPNMFKDAHEFCQACDHCQRTRNLSKRYEMHLQTILEVELFDVWGINFVGLFPPSWGNVYILVAIDYVSNWVKVVALPTNDAKLVLNFYIIIFLPGLVPPCALISDEDSHFDYKLVANALNSMGLNIKLPQHTIPRQMDKQMSLTTPLGMSPFKLVYRKPSHLPVKLEHKTYWAIKKLNMDWSVAGTNRLLKLNEMEEFRAQTCKNVKLYKEKTKRWHDNKILPRSHNKVNCPEVSGEKMLKHLGSTSTASPPMTTDVAPSTSHSDFKQQLEDDDEDGTETTAEKNIEKEGKEEKIESVHIESNKDEANITQTSTPATTTTTPKSTTPMTEQERVIHQLVDDFRKLKIDDDEEMPINQLKMKCYKQVVGKSVQDDAGEVERKQCYKRATRKSTQPN
ncbi:uncharacterized protein LOC105789533 [Gossypium raimondii]|uniref:uncharacterized protein LOC105789533 n=1 Tax=Gossypium raimondii TaxID=29730 RepID=UPI00063ACEB8|nr:uncharacterized protein LOC105789533 [Gossypium raimondii]